jgi:hypothetical protein
MSRQEQPEESLGGLARRWLKTQLKFNGDPIKSKRLHDETEAIEQQMNDKVRDDAASAAVAALIPDSWKRKIESLERANEEGRLQRERQQREEHEARPRVPFRLALTGSVDGSVETLIPIKIDMPSEPGDPLTVDLEPLEPVEIGGHIFLGLLFAVPAYSGPGVYDLISLEERLRLETWDPLWFQLTIDTTDDGLYWSPDYGPATVTVTETTMQLHMPMSNANGIDVMLDAVVEMPAPPA